MECVRKNTKNGRISREARIEIAIIEIVSCVKDRPKDPRSFFFCQSFQRIDRHRFQRRSPTLGSGISIRMFTGTGIYYVHPRANSASCRSYRSHRAEHVQQIMQIIQIPLRANMCVRCRSYRCHLGKRVRARSYRSHPANMI